MPKHLRFDGQVRNRKLNRKDTMRFVEELWHERDRLRTSGVRGCSFNTHSLSLGMIAFIICRLGRIGGFS